MADMVVAVLGASGALGKELLATLDRAPWRPDTVVALARASTTVMSVPYGEQELTVDDLATADLGQVSLAFVALPPSEAPAALDALIGAGVPTVDLSGHLLTSLETPLMLPWLGLDALERPRPHDVVSLPGGPANLVGTALAALARAGLCTTASATVQVPASHWGRQGVAELSQQVVALFNSGTPLRQVFEGGLAFDLLPFVGTPGGSGWTGAEVRASAEIARLSGVRCDVSLVGTPLFTGMGATVRIPCEPDALVERYERVLEEAGVVVQRETSRREVARPRKVDGSDRVHAARVRLAPTGDAVYLWLSGDNLQLSATGAVGAGGALLRSLGRMPTTDSSDEA